MHLTQFGLIFLIFDCLRELTPSFMSDRLYGGLVVLAKSRRISQITISSSFSTLFFTTSSIVASIVSQVRSVRWLVRSFSLTILVKQRMLIIKNNCKWETITDLHTLLCTYFCFHGQIICTPRPRVTAVNLSERACTCLFIGCCSPSLWHVLQLSWFTFFGGHHCFDPFWINHAW